MKVVYVGGPFRGPNAWEVEQNVRQAEALALRVWRIGLAAICPHANTRFFDKAAPDRAFLDGDLEILRRCDALLLTEDWGRSSGAIGEKLEAERIGIPIFYSLEALDEWRKVGESNALAALAAPTG